MRKKVAKQDRDETLKPVYLETLFLLRGRKAESAHTVGLHSRKLYEWRASDEDFAEKEREVLERVKDQVRGVWHDFVFEQKDKEMLKLAVQALPEMQKESRTVHEHKGQIGVAHYQLSEEERNKLIRVAAEAIEPDFEVLE